MIGKGGRDMGCGVRGRQEPDLKGFARQGKEFDVSEKH
jgi:hypothetical protein